ncbi:MAG: signal peptidase I [bacterium]
MAEYTIDNFVNGWLLKEAVCKNRSVWVKVNGRSMFPFFDNGTLVQVILCSLEDVHRGDIVIFEDVTDIVCHRVLKRIKLKGELFLKTKGDTSFYFDSPVKQEKVIGKILIFKRMGFNININNPGARSIGLFLSYLLPFVARSVYYLKKICILSESA